MSQIGAEVPQTPTPGHEDASTPDLPDDAIQYILKGCIAACNIKINFAELFYRKISLM